MEYIHNNERNRIRNCLNTIGVYYSFKKKNQCKCCWTESSFCPVIQGPKCLLMTPPLSQASVFFQLSSSPPPFSHSSSNNWSLFSPNGLVVDLHYLVIQALKIGYLVTVPASIHKAEQIKYNFSTKAPSKKRKRKGTIVIGI